jgi:signal transduction histidine kinase/CheY-like chemotaxis protein
LTGQSQLQELAATKQSKTQSLTEQTQTSVSCIDWSQMHDKEHFVQFYEADNYLLKSLSGFIGNAINAGDGAIVVATPVHRNGLDQLMRDNGINVSRAITQGQYVSLDASETLSRFMVDGSPEPARFNSVMSGLIASITDGRTRVSAFGEMVAVLWQQGNHVGAIKLEHLWTELQKSHAFSLFCAYPLNALRGEQMAQPTFDVCAAHTRVIPAESYASLTDIDARMREIALLQQRAHSLEAEVNERREIEERLRLALVGEQMARAEAETASRMKDEFLAVLSHELRTPLTSIYGWLSMLRAGKVEQSDIMKALHVIERNVKAQTQLVDDLLNVSRIITGNLKIAPQWIDAASVVNTAVDAIRPAAMAKNIRLTIEAPDSEQIFADPGRLQQVVWNLLTNAVKFTARNGDVKVEVARVASKIQISVSDTGEGIPPEFLPYVFDRFSQADASTTRKTGGLGLGLSIVRHLIELHGGTVIAHSEGTGRGTTMIIQIPVPGVRPRAASTRSGTQTGSLEGLKVMIVEDEDDTRDMLEHALQSYGASVLVAASAAEALQQIAGEQPDILISDIGLPNMDGYELLARVRSEMPETLRDIPAVALTAYSTDEHKERSRLAGYQAHISKPIAIPDLISVLSRVVREKER